MGKGNSCNERKKYRIKQRTFSKPKIANYNSNNGDNPIREGIFDISNDVFSFGVAINKMYLLINRGKAMPEHKVDGKPPY